jgi:hypothetical protein
MGRRVLSSVGCALAVFAGFLVFLSPAASGTTKPKAPDAPAQPTLSAVPVDPTGGELDVSWPAVRGAAANGSRVRHYTVNVYSAGELVGSTKVKPTSRTENPVTDQIAAVNGDTYTVNVTARNKVGKSAPSPASDPMTAFGQPGTVTDLSASQYDNGSTTLSFTAPDDNGQAITGYQYSQDGAAFQPLSSNDTISGLNNGQTYTFEIEACNTYCGSPSNSATAQPDVDPSAPPISVSQGATTVTFSWGVATSNGCPISSVQWGTQPGGPYPNASALSGGSWTAGNGYSQMYTIYIQATDSCGLTGENQATGTTGSQPTPSLTISEGGSTDTSGCDGSPTCHWINISGANFPPNGSWTLFCYDKGGQFFDSANYGFSISSNGSGAISEVPSGNTGRSCADSSGYGPIHVVIDNVSSNSIGW